MANLINISSLILLATSTKFRSRQLEAFLYDSRENLGRFLFLCYRDIFFVCSNLMPRSFDSIKILQQCWKFSEVVIAG